VNQKSTPSPESNQDPANARLAARQAPGRAEASEAAATRNQSLPTDLAEYIPEFRWPKDTSRFVFEVAGRDDAEALNDLFERAFGQRRPLAHFLWKYWENPAGPPYGVVARERDGSRLLAAAFGQRRIARVDGRDVPANLMCEISSDPTARAGGIAFKGVMQAIGIGLRDEAGICWSYGGQSSDEAIKVGSRWLGFRIVLELVTWECRLSLRPALEARVGPALGKLGARLLDPWLRARWRHAARGFFLEEVEDFGPEFDELWRRHADRYRLVFRRDAETLRWRWRDCPVGRHRILLARRGGPSGEPLGWVIWRQWEDSGSPVATVLDLWTGGDEEVIQALLDGARRMAAMDGAHWLRFAVRPDSPEEHALRALGHFRPSPHVAVDRVIATPMPGRDRDFDEDELAVLRVVVDGGNWYYTQGDCDFRD